MITASSPRTANTFRKAETCLPRFMVPPAERASNIQKGPSRFTVDSLARGNPAHALKYLGIKRGIQELNRAVGQEDIGPFRMVSAKLFRHA